MPVSRGGRDCARGSTSSVPRQRRGRGGRPLLGFDELPGEPVADLHEAPALATALLVLRNALEASPEAAVAPWAAVEAQPVLVPGLKPLRKRVALGVRILDLDEFAHRCQASLGRENQRSGRTAALVRRVDGEEAPMTAAIGRPARAESGAGAAHQCFALEGEVQHAVSPGSRVTHLKPLQRVVVVDAFPLSNARVGGIDDVRNLFDHPTHLGVLRGADGHDDILPAIREAHDHAVRGSSGGGLACGVWQSGHVILLYALLRNRGVDLRDFLP
mmetsp:Transcript_58922/g.164641  ORF Transcript_58922/g.164641 Transcript_58922/m.164641 type:complete len:273 (+) Transcript_58922:126-944(+)